MRAGAELRQTFVRHSESRATFTSKLSSKSCITRLKVHAREIPIICGRVDIGRTAKPHGQLTIANSRGGRRFNAAYEEAEPQMLRAQFAVIACRVLHSSMIAFRPAGTHG